MTIFCILTLVPMKNESNMWPTDILSEEIKKCSEYQSGHAAFTVYGVWMVPPNKHKYAALTAAATLFLV